MLRERLLAEFGALTAREIADLAGSGAVNRAQYAHALTRAGKVFSVVHRRQVLYPGFQFSSSNGAPIPAIAILLPVLRSRFQGEWEIALWFATPNSWLGGRRPLDVLRDDEDGVIKAAQAGATRGGF